MVVRASARSALMISVDMLVFWLIVVKGRANEEWKEGMRNGKNKEEKKKSGIVLRIGWKGTDLLRLLSIATQRAKPWSSMCCIPRGIAYRPISLASPH
jgi:hypothetical protein